MSLNSPELTRKKKDSKMVVNHQKTYTSIEILSQLYCLFEGKAKIQNNGC